MEYTFKITVFDGDVMGDEFWDDALTEDPSGVAPLTKAIITALEDSNLFQARPVKEMVELVEFKKEE